MDITDVKDVIWFYLTVVQNLIVVVAGQVLTELKKEVLNIKRIDL